MKKFCSIKKFSKYFFTFLTIFFVLTTVFAQFNTGGGFNQPQGFGPQGGFDQGMPSGFQNQGMQTGSFDVGINTSAADPEYVAKQKFVTGMTTAYTWVSANATEFVKGCKSDRDGLVQKLDYVIQQSQETSSICEKFAKEAKDCNPETFCSQFEKGKLPMPPEAKIALKKAGYNPETITINQMNEELILKMCMSGVNAELDKAKKKGEEMKEQIKSQISDFRKGCEQFKQMESQRNQGFKLPGFGQQMSQPPGGWGQMGPQGPGQACGTGSEPDGRGGCKQSQEWQGQGSQGKSPCDSPPPEWAKNCKNYWDCNPQRGYFCKEGDGGFGQGSNIQQEQWNGQPGQYGPQQGPGGQYGPPQGGGCQGTPPNCPNGWNCNNGFYQCNEGGPQPNQQYPQQPPTGQQYPQPGPGAQFPPGDNTYVPPVSGTENPPQSPPPSEPPPQSPPPSPPPSEPPPAPAPGPSATTQGNQIISSIATAFASIFNLQEAADSTATTDVAPPNSTSSNTVQPEQPISNQVGGISIPGLGEMPSPPQEQGGFGGGTQPFGPPQGFDQGQGFGPPQGISGMPGVGNNAKNCPAGEYYGMNDQGQYSCIRPGNVGGGQGFGGPQGGFGGGQNMGPQNGGGPGMGRGMPPEQMCELSDDEIIETFSGNMEDFMPPKGQMEYMCKQEAGNILRELSGLKLGIAQCKANAAIKCAADQEAANSCNEIQNDPNALAKSIVEDMCRRFGVTASSTDAKGKLYDLAKKWYNYDPALANQFGDTADQTKSDQKKLDIISYLVGNGDYGNKLKERSEKLKAVKERLEEKGADPETISALDSEMKTLSDEGSKFSNAFDITRLGYIFRPSD